MICGGVPNEDTVEVVVVQFGSAFARLFDADARSKRPKVFEEVWTSVESCLKRSRLCDMVDTLVVEISCVKQGGGPIPSWTSQAVEEGASCHSKSVVPFLCTSILQGAVRSCRFNDVSCGLKERRPKRFTASKFTAKVSVNNSAGRETMQSQEVKDQVCRRFFRFP